MKNKLFTLLILGLLTFGSSITLVAQTNQTTVDHIINLIGSPTNYAAELYGTYAPKAPIKIGGGIFVAYNFNQYAGMGVALDWLGEFSLVSGNVQLQAPFHPLPNQFPSLLMSPFALAGAGTPYSGDGKFNGTPVIVTTVGAYFKFGHAWGGSFNTGASYGKWSGSGPYDVPRYHIFAGWNKGF